MRVYQLPYQTNTGYLTKVLCNRVHGVYTRLRVLFKKKDKSK